jgi:alkylation response protein AidB-like acyl-CoA dehydrogenase
MERLLRRLLRDDPRPREAADVGPWWQAVAARAEAAAGPFDHAVLGGFQADRLGFAFAAGYQAALRALVPALPAGEIVAFCATERAGNHARAIETRLHRVGHDLALTGAKRWSTMGPLARTLLVVASEGTDAAGRKRLRLVATAADAPGVKIAAMPPTSFVPEVPHAEIVLDGVPVDAAAVLPGDGYVRYVKPFRTVEDLHVHGACLGYLVAVSRRHAFPRHTTERLVAGIAAARTLARLDASAPEVHVALAGVLAEGAALIADLAPCWTGVETGERERWERDRALLGAVAGIARERRRQRAWEILEQGPAGETGPA